MKKNVLLNVFLHSALLFVVNGSLLHAFELPQAAHPGQPSVDADEAENSRLPPYISFSAALPEWASHNGQSAIGMKFAFYQSRDSVTPLWQEVQNVQPEASGRYTVVLGIQHRGGVPSDLFSNGTARWLGISVDGQPEEPRVLLLTVPYAYRAMVADSLGGHETSEFVLAQDLAVAIKKQLNVLLSSSGALAITKAPDLSALASPAPVAPNGNSPLLDNNDTEVLLVSQLGTGYAIRATSNSGAALAGINSGATAGGIAIYGASSASSGVGLRADSLASAGAGIGVWGVSSSNGTGVLGESTVATGPAYGVRGKTQSTSGIGVFGVALSTSGTVFGVRGENRSPEGSAGIFDTYPGGKILTGVSAGVERFSVDSDGNLKANRFVGSGAGLTSVDAATLNGLPASAFLTSQFASINSNNGSSGLSVSQQGNGYAIQATSTTNAAVAGISTSQADGAMAIYGVSAANNGVGLRADTLAASGAGIGIWGTSANNGTGVLGETTITSGPAYGVRGKTQSTSGIGVFGVNLSLSGNTTGVRGESRSPNGIAGAFDAYPGGKIISGTSAGVERLSVDSDGNLAASGKITASLLVGSGAGLTEVNAVSLDGLPASSFLTAQNPTINDNSFNDGFQVTQLGTGSAVRATSTGGTALIGINTGLTDGAVGITGSSSAKDGIGLRADSLASTGAGVGIWGVSSSLGTGVLGESTVSDGLAYGVRGTTLSKSGIGVFGLATSTTGPTVGVRGENSSVDGVAGQFESLAAGKILSGISSGQEQFSVDSTGNLSASGTVKASSFVGSGAELTGVNAETLNGLTASSFLRSESSDILTNSILAGTAGGTSGQGGLLRDDLDSVHSVTAQSGSNYHFRLTRGDLDAEGHRPDFLITPYNFGMAMEYPGVLEIWVRELSVHNHPNVSGGGPAQFWVGDEVDSGGLWATSHVNSPTSGGSVTIAADKFDHSSHGSMHFTVRNPTDSFLFTNGPLNQEIPIGQVRKIKDATHDLTTLESINGVVDGAIVADALNGSVKIGSRTNHPVQLVTGDSNAALTAFSSGNVSIGNAQDATLFTVGSAAQFQVDATGATTIGGGTPILKHLSAADTVDFGTVSKNACAVQSIGITGAEDGDTVAIGVPNALGSVDGVTYFGWVSAPDVVSVRACNIKTEDVEVSFGVIRVDIWKH